MCPGPVQQAELKHLLEPAARVADVETTRALADHMRGELAGRYLGDSAGLVAEDRDR
jgi:hypothetical protein